MEPESTPGLIHLAAFLQANSPEFQNAEEEAMEDSDEFYPQDWNEEADLL